MEFYAHEAASGRQLGPAYRDADMGEIDDAARAAESAFAVYSLVPQSARAAFLESIANEIEQSSPAIIERAALETGLSQSRLENEKNRTLHQLRSMADLLKDGSWVDARIDRGLPERKPPRPDIRCMLRPLGPVAIFGASNFPLAYSVAGGDTASALAAGNPVVVKAHPAHPGTSDLTAEAIRRAIKVHALPEGVFGMVHGSSHEVSIALVSHPSISAVGFTGSLRAGRALFDAASARPKPIPVFAEMGSVNPVYILPGALKEKRREIAEGLVNSFTLGVGQYCTKPGIVFGIGSTEWDDFCMRVAARAKQVPAGVMLHQTIAATFKKSTSGLHDVGWLADGPNFVARADSSRFRSRPDLAREIFGPFTLLVSVRDQAEMLDIAREQEGQLTSTVHSTQTDREFASRLFDELGSKAGRLINNGFPTGVEVLPSMTHGGPYPATTDARFSAVGTASIFRFARPVSFQNFPDYLLPAELRDENPLGICRLVDGANTREPL